MRSLEQMQQDADRLVSRNNEPVPVKPAMTPEERRRAALAWVGTSSPFAADGKISCPVVERVKP